ncbi:ABC transporter permease [Anaerocolumna cellulosilytica]|uniref:ABC transporter permease n=1 Tax=Anaerocolumna cellulosilytica TaxID=433286 RepID=A0A6S6QVS1_9FIRM|nr:sugar ABC transporter permease [Anaerocolumna cellulosilytica]MBB5197858.1 multiple sugar transport system permease protein [Anaerocolumna cellulosilytica]BCJ93169.1 ABC transporter permease [Anaerocolumna cellulosilytica]
MKKNKEPFSLVWKHHKNKYLLIAPFAIVFLVFTLIPVVVSIVLSFTSFNMVEAPSFNGLSNYINLLVRDDVFLIAIKNTLLFALITGPISYIMCFLFAWMINELPPVPRSIITLVFYAPSISGNAYMIWKLIFSSDTYGWANAWLLKLGFIQSRVMWFETAKYVMPILIVVQLWLSLGVSFLAFIAGLQNVDKSWYEAAAVEGVKNRWQELWYITLPSMKPQLMFGAVMQITGSLSVSQISIDLAGFPSVSYAGHTILTHLHDYGNVRYELGYACTIAVVLFFIMLLCNIIVQKLLRKLG